MRLARIWIWLAVAAAVEAAPVRIIFDTDIGNDIDDALALAMLHAMESRGEAKLLAVTITKDNPWAPGYIRVVNRFYGREIPLGIVKGGKTPEDSKFLHAAGSAPAADVPDATSVLREVLSKEADGAVTIVQVGFFTNLARLLDSAGGTDLVKRKVNRLVLMAGAFPSGPPEYNVKIDVAAAKKVFADWPTPIVTSGFEIGKSILFPASAIESKFNYVEHHPIAEAYRLYQKMPYDRPTWDLTAVLWAVRPGQYFRVGAKGRVKVDDAGKTTLEGDPNGPHGYLVVDEGGRRNALEAMIELSSRKPDGR